MRTNVGQVTNWLLAGVPAFPICSDIGKWPIQCAALLLVAVVGCSPTSSNTPRPVVSTGSQGAPTDSGAAPSPPRDDASGSGAARAAQPLDPSELPAAVSAGNVLDLAAGDLDGDGDIDLVSAQEDDTLILENEGEGTLTAVAGFRSAARAVLLGDFNGDERLDLVLGEGSRPVAGVERGIPDRLLLGTEDDGLVDSGQSLGSGITTTLAAGDLDGDADLDLVAGELNGIRVYRNDGAGVLQDTRQNFRSRRTGAVALGDLDADEDLDLMDGSLGQPLAPGAFGADPLFSWRNDSRARYRSFRFAGSQARGRTQSLELGDLDGDLDLDLTAGQDEGLRLLINQGTSLETAPDIDARPVSSHELADVDQDGDLDIVAGGEAGVILARSSGGSRPSFTVEELSLAPTTSVVITDIDGDGRADVIRGGPDGIEILSAPE